MTHRVSPRRRAASAWTARTLAPPGPACQSHPVSILDLTGKNAFVTGVSDDGGFAWAIAKALGAAGANVYLACHPRVVGIVERFVTKDKYAESRKLPYGVEGELEVKGIIPCDVEFDRAEDVPEERRASKGYAGLDASIAGSFAKFDELTAGGGVDILIHSVAFSPEIQKPHLEVSRAAYLQAVSISSYSMVALVREALPRMEGRDASVVGLSYLASQRVTPGYGGGMATAKAALECDARSLAWFAGEAGVRVNILSPGAYPSRAAKSIGAIQDMVAQSAQRSPLRRAISAEEVADACLFMCSPLARGITGDVVYVDAGFHAMSAL